MGALVQAWGVFRPRFGLVSTAKGMTEQDAREQLARMLAFHPAPRYFVDKMVGKFIPAPDPQKVDSQKPGP